MALAGAPRWMKGVEGQAGDRCHPARPILAFPGLSASLSSALQDLIFRGDIVSTVRE